MADRAFAHSGSAAWDVDRALDIAEQAGAAGMVQAEYRAAVSAMEPAPRQWFGQRLPVLWTMFMTARAADPKALTIWLGEAAYLLGDLPHDIVAHAIDEAVRSSRHGFMPTVGEIRGVAEPLLAARRVQIERLARMVDALDDPAATAARADRREEARRRAAAH